MTSQTLWNPDRELVQGAALRELQIANLRRQLIYLHTTNAYYRDRL